MRKATPGRGREAAAAAAVGPGSTASAHRVKKLLDRELNTGERLYEMQKYAKRSNHDETEKLLCY